MRQTKRRSAGNIRFQFFGFGQLGHPAAARIVNVQDFHAEKVFCRAVPSDRAYAGNNFLLGLELKSELHRTFSELARRFHAESAAAKGDLAIAKRVGETGKAGQADRADGKRIVRRERRRLAPKLAAVCQTSLHLADQLVALQGLFDDRLTPRAYASRGWRSLKPVTRMTRGRSAPVAAMARTRATP